MSGKPMSIGMAVFRDFDGVYFTTQSLLAHHRHLVGQIIVVDNDPNERIARYCRTIGATYVPFPEPKGTAAPRQEIFRHAKFDRTLVVDSHVLLEPGALDALDVAVQDDDLYHGPLMYDWGSVCATHMDDVWRGEMWGIWGHARSKDGSPPFSWVETKAIDLATGQVNPDIKPAYPDYLGELDRQGYVTPKVKFEIPAHGMGLWACRTGSWLGFNSQFREFGGEEWYIHEKYRQAGRKVWCVPEAKWRHRFSDLTGHSIPYPLSRIAKVKNYVIGHRELGLPLDRIEKEFLGRGLISQKEWDMACGCNSKAGAPPVNSGTVATELTALAEGRVVDFSGSEWPKAEVVSRPINAASAPLVECDTLCLSDAAYALGRWAGKSPRVVVKTPAAQVAAFMRAYPSYTLIRDIDGWLMMSSVPEDKPKMIGAGSTVVNGLKALARAGKAAVSGGSLPLVSDATQEARFDKCLVCPKRVDMRCSECGCFVDKKTWVATEACPIGQWGRVV
jgi:hypothetical protein